MSSNEDDVDDDYGYGEMSDDESVNALFISGGYDYSLKDEIKKSRSHACMITGI